jgi:hypothetical protein
VLPDPITWSGAMPFSTQLMTASKSAPFCGHGPRLFGDAASSPPSIDFGLRID